MPRLDEAIPLVLGHAVEAASAGRPGVGTFEGLVGAFLATAADDRTALAGVEALRESGRLDPEGLAGTDPADVEESWRLAGARSLRKSAPPLVRLAAWVERTFRANPDGRLDSATTTEGLREGLRTLKGVGPATADAILLDGLGRAAYPVDRATYRVLVRHGWLDATASYDEARAVVEAALPEDPAGLARLASGFGRLGRETCRASVARCERCPLRPLLPEGGPLGDS